MKKDAKVKENSPRAWSIPPLCAQDNKYTRGHVLVLGGAEMTGAARLAALAAQRAGAGVVTLAATQSSWPIYAASLMSVITRPCTLAHWRALVADGRVNPVLMGPGAGVGARTKTALSAAAAAGKTLILDADALTVLATDAKLRAAISPCAKILTPHEGEYRRLAEALRLDSTLGKRERAQTLAQCLQAVVVLKGGATVISDGVKTLVTHPPHWLATAGTGDVLAGIIAALVGQGMEPFDAAAAGVWLHSEAAREHGHGMIAEDVIASLPALLQQLSGQ